VRKALHLHLLVWLCGSIPSEAELRERLADSQELANLLAEYTEWLRCTELPIEEESASCPNCAAGHDHFEVVECPANDVPKKVTAQATPTVKCNECNTTINPVAALEEAARIILENDDDHTDHPAYVLYMNDTDSFLQSKYNDAPAEHQKAIMMLRVLATNMHSQTHNKTCFKGKKKGRPCRFKFPKAPQETTTFTVSLNGGSIDLRASRPMRDEDEPLEEEEGRIFQDGDLVMQTKRQKLGQWLVGYNETLVHLFGCNHDVKVLLTATIDLVYYVLGYTNKAQSEMSDASLKALLKSFKNREERVRAQVDADGNGNADTAQHEERRRLMATGLGNVLSYLWHMSGQREIGSVMAAYYMLYDGFSVVSHKFSNLFLGQAIAYLSNERVSGLLQRRRTEEGTHEVEVVPSTFDYAYRPHQFADVCLYEFVRYYKKQRVPASRSSSEAPPTTPAGKVV